MREHIYEKKNIHARILATQKERMDELVNIVNEEYGLKLTFSDIIREVIEAGLQTAKETRDKWALDYL